MVISTTQILQQAQRDGYAVGAFNVYTLEKRIHKTLGRIA